MYLGDLINCYRSLIDIEFDWGNYKSETLVTQPKTSLVLTLSTEF